MMSACMPLSRKYSAIAAAGVRREELQRRGSDAVAATMMEYSSAPFSSAS